MIYEEAVYRSGGDLYLSVEFGDEANLALNFKVLALQQAIEQSRIRGITETLPTMRSLGVVYDPFVVSQGDLIGEMRRLEKQLGEAETLPSRLLIIPMWYNDPWSIECAAAHGLGNNIEFVARHNNMTVEQVIGTHSGPEHWCTAVGFTPGVFITYSLDPERVLTAPKYERPRKWTYDRILNIGGHATSIYSVRSPGGYQLIGRTPLNTYEPEQRNAIFKNDPALTRAGDRHRYLPIGEEEYGEIRRTVEQGTYDYKVIEGTFNVKEYLAQVRAFKEKRNV